MRKTSLKPIILSALLATTFAATTVGTTFALFTDRADTTITVTAGKVDIESDVKIAKYENVGSAASGQLTNKTEVFENGATSYTTEVGTSFVVSDDTLTITNMIPGDKLTVNVALYNKSNVKTKYRLAISNNSGALANAITVTTTAGHTSWEPLDAYTGDSEDGGLVETGVITFEFVEHGEGILAKEDQNSTDNKYMGKQVTYTLAYEVVQGNANVQ